MIDISHIDHHHTDGHEEHNSHDKHFKSDRINDGTVFYLTIFQYVLCWLC